jgi:biopolymer transport protein ExbD
MGAVDAPQPRSAGGKKGKGFHRPKRRVGIKIDMTPMVDIAFLLLIFFMVTTVFRKPQALEINLPPHDVKIEVAESKVLLIRVLDDRRVYYKRGQDPWARTDLEAVDKMLQPYRGSKELVVVIKVDRDAEFRAMVDVIDELDLAQLSRFSLAELTPEEKQEVETL